MRPLRLRPARLALPLLLGLSGCCGCPGVVPPGAQVGQELAAPRSLLLPPSGGWFSVTAQSPDGQPFECAFWARRDASDLVVTCTSSGGQTVALHSFDLTLSRAEGPLSLEMASHPRWGRGRLEKGATIVWTLPAPEGALELHLRIDQGPVSRVVLGG